MSKKNIPIPEEEGNIQLLSKPVIEEPKLYKVIMLNDHYTTMDFVVEVIMQVFHKPEVEAKKIMLEIHTKGKGVVGIYPYDIALTKIEQVHELARLREFPLRCTYEEA